MPEEICIYLENTNSKTNKNIIQFLREHIEKISKKYEINIEIVINKKKREKIKKITGGTYPLVKVRNKYIYGKEDVVKFIKSICQTIIRKAPNKPAFSTTRDYQQQILKDDDGELKDDEADDFKKNMQDSMRRMQKERGMASMPSNNQQQRENIQTPYVDIEHKSGDDALDKWRESNSITPGFGNLDDEYSTMEPDF